MSNLYKVTLQGLTVNSVGRAQGISYVVADSPDEAFGKVKKYLDGRDYGFAHERQLKTVELIAEERECGRLAKLYL